MLQSKQIYFYTVILSLVVLAGCGKSLRYEPKELRDLTVVTAGHWVTQDNVTVLTKRFTAQDNEFYFNKADLRYIAVQVTINNRSEEEWVLTPDFINISLVPMHYVYDDMSPSFLRVLGMRMAVGTGLSTMYSLRQLDAKSRISKDLCIKTLEQPISIPAGKKGSVILFMNKKNIKRRLIMKLGHADTPGKCLDFELLLI